MSYAYEENRKGQVKNKMWQLYVNNVCTPPVVNNWVFWVSQHQGMGSTQN